MKCPHIFKELSKDLSKILFIFIPYTFKTSKVI